MNACASPMVTGSRGSGVSTPRHPSFRTCRRRGTLRNRSILVGSRPAVAHGSETMARTGEPGRFLTAGESGMGPSLPLAPRIAPLRVATVARELCQG